MLREALKRSGNVKVKVICTAIILPLCVNVLRYKARSLLLCQLACIAMVVQSSWKGSKSVSLMIPLVYGEVSLVPFNWCSRFYIIPPSPSVGSKSGKKQLWLRCHLVSLAARMAPFGRWHMLGTGPDSGR